MSEIKKMEQACEIHHPKDCHCIRERFKRKYEEVLYELKEKSNEDSNPNSNAGGK